MVISPAVVSAAEPQWEDFCPAPYRNLDSSKQYTMKNKKYWQVRKNEFEKSVDQCTANFAGDKLSACYEQIRETEKTRTDNWYQQQAKTNYTGTK